jgi:hypothetical protein
VHTKKGKCLPWHGQFAADEATPLDDDGVAVLPGVRACGHNDCVNPSHITKERVEDDKE